MVRICVGKNIWPNATSESKKHYMMWYEDRRNSSMGSSTGQVHFRVEVSKNRNLENSSS